MIMGWQGAVGTLSLQGEPLTIIGSYTVIKTPWGMHHGRKGGYFQA